MPLSREVLDEYDELLSKELERRELLGDYNADSEVLRLVVQVTRDMVRGLKK